MSINNKLPFSVTLEKKYNEVNVNKFLAEWQEGKDERKNRLIGLDNDLHIEMAKFKTYKVSMSEIINLGMRYALAKQEFKKMTAEIIHQKNLKKNN